MNRLVSFLWVFAWMRGLSRGGPCLVFGEIFKTPPSDIPTTGHTPAYQDFHLYGCENQDGSASLLAITAKKSSSQDKEESSIDATAA